ncbi:MAG: hypothetical protein FWF45_01190 [Coriobacteriia bacterium]|nr:hypothetical protein [Coriobacteriia bacterium]
MADAWFRERAHLIMGQRIYQILSSPGIVNLYRSPGFPILGNLVMCCIIFVCCGLFPAVLLHVLMKAFRKRSFGQVRNYAGRTVPLGLGFIWPLWAIGLVSLSLVFRTVYLLFDRMGHRLNMLSPFLTGYAQAPSDAIGLGIAVAAVFAFGLIDDLGVGTPSKGFKGHLKALLQGHLTTGLVKLIGIGATALLFAWYLWGGKFYGAIWAQSGGNRVMLVVLLTGFSLALCANFVNLCDLRPGRASKVTLLLLVGGFVYRLVISWIASGHALSGGLLFQSFLSQVSYFLIFLLPVLATMRYDLREQGMLGDAGANPAGFIAGAYIVTTLGLSGLIVFLLIMLALNLISEKISFSRVIEKNPLLLWLDQIGRIKTGRTDREEENTD